MSKKLDFNQMADHIIDNLGGRDNLSNINHCATRLRVVVKDVSKVSTEELKKVDGVLGIEVRDGETQVIVGAIIEDLFIEVEKKVGKKEELSNSNERKKVSKILSNFLQMMAGIMSPVIPSLIAAGFLTCLLLILNLVFGLETTNSTYVILNNLAQSVFYFLPVFVAFTSAKKFNTEPVLAMLLACWLLYPEWVSMASNGGFTSYFGLPAMLTTYNGAVIQIILSVWVMSKFDVLLKKFLPLSARHFLKPFLLILMTSVVTLTLTGPLGGLFTDYIKVFIEWVNTNASWATVPAIVLLSTTLGLVAPGFHLALIPLATASLESVGYDAMINIWFYCCTITPGFIALAVALKTKKPLLKQTGFSASLSALFGGISEPTIYGISYKMPKIYLCSVITSLITALYAGIVGLKCYGFGGYSLTNILLYLGTDKDTHNFMLALIGVGIMAVSSFVLVFLTKWDDSNFEEENRDEIPTVKKVECLAPAKGSYVAQEKIEDNVFASGTLGKCFGICPEIGEIYAPVSGIVNSVAPSNHAITIKSDEGAEIMVHIGIDTMKLTNEITSYVKVGQHVKANEKIAYFDKQAFDEKGIKDTVIVILLNSDYYHKITVDSDSLVMIAEA